MVSSAGRRGHPLDQAHGRQHLDRARYRTRAGLQPVGKFTCGNRRLLGEQQSGQHPSGHALQPVVGEDERELFGCILVIWVVGHASPFWLFSNL